MIDCTRCSVGRRNAAGENPVDIAAKGPDNKADAEELEDKISDYMKLGTIY